MKHFGWRHRAALLVAAILVPVLMGAKGKGCGGNGGPSGGCVETGCSGQICAEEDMVSTCEWQESYACFQDHGICERNAEGECGWRQTPELQECLDQASGRTPATGPCIRNSGDACESDADCTAGGCGGELCFNPSVSEGVSTCDCTAPQGPSCGCVSGVCTWWN